MLEVSETGHEIVGDRSARRMLMQDVHLEALKLADHLRAEASKIQGVCRIRLARCAIGQLDFIEAPVFRAPEYVAPSLVQTCNVPISLSKPLAEL